MLSSDGLALLHDSMAAHVAAGHLPGLVTLVAHGDELHVDTIGSPSFGSDAPLRRDAIFRIASLTKPITAAATLSLVDEGLLRLAQPVDELLPELANRRVLRAIDAELDDTVPAKRPITLEDLLSYRLGFGSVMAPPGSYPIQRAEAELGLHSIGGPPWPPVGHDPDGWMAALGSLPLMHQPGERWLYNTSAQVLGVLLARACGRDLESVLRERILDPLGMADTGFTVPAEQLGRLTTAYRPDPETGQLWVLDDPADSWWSRPHLLPGRQRLAGVDDRRLLVVRLDAAGRWDRPGGRVLSPETVALMTTDRLTPDQREDSACFWASTAAGAWAWRCRPPVPIPRGFPAGSAGPAAAARPGDRALEAASRASCSASAASHHPCPSRWPWASGPGQRSLCGRLTPAAYAASA